MEAWRRSMELCTSEVEDFLMTITLSSDPVSTRVFFKPSDNISKDAKTKTTNAMPPAVNTVVKRRVRRFLTLYKKGIFKNTPSVHSLIHPPQSIDNTDFTGMPGR